MILHYIFLGIISIMAMLLLCIIINKNETITRKLKFYFTSAIIGTIMVTLCEIGTYFFEKPHTNLWIQSLLCDVIGFSVSPFIPIFIAFAICNLEFSKYKAWFLPPIISMFFTMLSPFYGLIFSVSSENIYTRGPLFSIFILAYLWGICVLIQETVKLTKRYQTKSGFVLYLLLFFILFGTTIQIIFPMVHTTWICIALSVTIYYAYFCELSEKFDAQTYLLNRRAYNCAVERMEESWQASVLIFDIDDFKIVNDTYGHPFGDYCLITVAGCIKDVFQEIGLCFRIGGDEFCVITKTADEAMLEEAKNKFLKKIEKCREKDAKIPNVSVGHGIYKKGLCKVDEVIQKADDQLYEFKNRSKNIFVKNI
ncbi:MAG: diguanylate cyclase [Anaerotignum sp.]|nr:diguanylate cyclase [Anaerotignum sp.]